MTTTPLSSSSSIILLIFRASRGRTAGANCGFDGWWQWTSAAMRSNAFLSTATESGVGQDIIWVSRLSGVRRKALMSWRMRRMVKPHQGMRVSAPLPAIIWAMRLPQTSWGGGVSDEVDSREAVPRRWGRGGDGLPPGCWSGTFCVVCGGVVTGGRVGWSSVD
ncbi:hypothetical protein CONLIGDRAFT_497053 [Coniochaeta ligniaria NRRL 30616]|uniref:Uncharacterized protein n=1 Tax=Coniochaeta ligniaria NRRL 30616 TaxID=1408157 RepID=A0A1J7J3L6_9PEZI|nr:hypothetical protein CONLIGDRAFT_497053 [Coniochaeta ligniaria NRRL 30616]